MTPVRIKLLRIGALVAFLAAGAAFAHAETSFLRMRVDPENKDEMARKISDAVQKLLDGHCKISTAERSASSAEANRLIKAAQSDLSRSAALFTEIGKDKRSDVPLSPPNDDDVRKSDISSLARHGVAMPTDYSELYSEMASTVDREASELKKIEFPNDNRGFNIQARTVRDLRWTTEEIFSDLYDLAA